MNANRFAVGAAAGFMLAAILIAGLSIAGTGASHVALVRTSTQTAVTPAPSTQTGLSSGALVNSQAGAETTQSSSISSSGPSISSVASLRSHGFGTMGIVLIPIIVGALLGAVFYGAYTRRLETE